MARIKSKKFTGVYLNHMANGDISYSIVYKNENNITKRFTVGKKSNGITETYANTKRNEFINDIRLGQEPEAVTKRKKKKIITFDSIAMQHYDFKALHNRRNDKNRQIYITHIKPFIGNKNITSIKTSDIEAIQKAKVSEGKSPKYCNDIINEISITYNWAFERGLYEGVNPAKKVKRLSVDNERERFLTVDEVKLLIEAVKDNEQLYIFVLLALNTGGRLNAIATLRKKDIDLSNGIANLKDEKRNITYKVFIEDPILLNMLSERMKQIKANDAILDYKHPGLTKIDQHIQTKMKPILDKLFNQSLKATDRKNRVVIHSLRHTFASHLAINGTPIFTIQKLMNHSDINMTMRYAKLAPDSGRDAVKGLYRG